jgi:hypothetical protein
VYNTVFIQNSTPVRRISPLKVLGFRHAIEGFHEEFDVLVPGWIHRYGSQGVTLLASDLLVEEDKMARGHKCIIYNRLFDVLKAQEITEIAFPGLNLARFFFVASPDKVGTGNERETLKLA